MSIAIIANPMAGRGRGRKISEQVKRYLVDKGQDFELIYTQAPRQAIELARNASVRHDKVVALGGDGTISEVLEGMWDTQAHLGIIPGGTGNDHARGLAIPLNPLKAVDVILQGYTSPMDVGVEEDKIFGVMASIGFPVSVIKYVNDHREGPLRGPLAILAAVWQTVSHLQAYPVTVNVDGDTRDFNTVGILVMNMAYGGGGLKFAPRARHDDGQFSVVIIGDISKTELLTTLPKTYKGNHVSHPAVTILTGRRVTIESANLPKMFDGDLRGTTPLNAYLVPAATRVITPQPASFIQPVVS